MDRDDDRWVATHGEPFEDVCAELTELSRLLQEWLPDPSIGPEERLERLARVVPDSILCSQFRLNARTKLTRIRRRLDELAPDVDGAVEQLLYLRRVLDELVPGEQAVIQKLESIHDYRGADIGVSPRGWA